MFNARLVVRKWNGPRVKGKISEANRRLVGRIAYSAQETARDLAHVETGRMRGATTVVSTGSNFSVDRHASVVDYGKNLEECIDEVKTEVGGAGGGQHATVVVGSFVPYAYIEEVLRGHRFVMPGIDHAHSEVPGFIRTVGEELGFR